MRISAFSLSLFVLSLTSISAFASEPKWSFHKLAPSGSGNRKVALRLDAQGMPHIAYTGCTDAPCKNNELMHGVLGKDGKWSLESVDSAGKDTGWFASMEIASEGAIHLLYANHAKAHLQYALRSAGSADWKKDAIGSGHGGWWTSTALAASTNKLWVAATGLDGGWDNPNLVVGVQSPGADWSFDSADHGNNVGWFTSTTLDGNESPVVTYITSGYPVGDLRLIRRTENGAWDTDWVDRQSVKSSVQVDAQGVIHVIYQFAFDNDINHSNLMYGRSTAPGKWELTLVDGNEQPVAETGWHPTLVLDPSGGRHTLYRDAKQNCLIYSHDLGQGWSKPACVGKRGDGGLYPSAAFDSRGTLHVAYDAGNDIFYGTCEGCLSR